MFSNEHGTHEAFLHGSDHLQLAEAMNDATEQLMMILDMRASTKVKAHVNKCVEAGVCVACERADGKPFRRGLCGKCYSQWIKERSKLDQRAAALFDCRLIRVGRLLASQSIRRIRSTNIFKKLAQ